jgi:antitoxin ParD1/3/4
MNIRLKPEIEELIKQDLQSGAYQSIDEYVEHAVSILHAREAWLAENRAEISAKIEEGYAAAQRGELIPEDEVRRSTEAHKRAWLAEHRKGSLARAQDATFSRSGIM